MRDVHGNNYTQSLGGSVIYKNEAQLNEKFKRGDALS